MTPKSIKNQSKNHFLMAPRFWYHLLINFLYLYHWIRNSSNPQNHLKTYGFSYFLKNPPLTTYDQFTFDSDTSSASFLYQKSTKIQPKNYKSWQCFLNHVSVDIFFDFGSVLGGFGEPIGALEAHFWIKNGEAPLKVLRFDNESWSRSPPRHLHDRKWSPKITKMAPQTYKNGPPTH